MLPVAALTCTQFVWVCHPSIVVWIFTSIVQCSVFAACFIRCEDVCPISCFTMESDYFPCAWISIDVFTNFNHSQASIHAVQLSRSHSLTLHSNPIEFSAVEVNDSHILIDKHSVTNKTAQWIWQFAVFLLLIKAAINCSFLNVVHSFATLRVCRSSAHKCMQNNAPYPLDRAAVRTIYSWKTMIACL